AFLQKRKLRLSKNHRPARAKVTEHVRGTRPGRATARPAASTRAAGSLFFDRWGNRDPAGCRGSSHLPQQLKFTTSDSCDRIKDEFQLLQAQYHSLKLECDKLASEKSEMQRHYVMYYEMSYGLNIEMHKQAEIVKRLNGICAQVLPYLSQEHQQQVLGAIERAKQVTAPELNSIIRVCMGTWAGGRGTGGPQAANVPLPRPAAAAPSPPAVPAAGPGPALDPTARGAAAAFAAGGQRRHRPPLAVRAGFPGPPLQGRQERARR
ncbi:AES isoform 2, partial [Pan troglodytes]